MAGNLRVAAVQMSSQDDVGANLARITVLVAQAADAGAEIVVLPENFAYFGSEEGKRAAAEAVGSAPGPILTAVAEAARRARVHVIAGGMPERAADPARPYNACVVVSPDGNTIAKYRKVHLFDVDVGDGQRYCESASTTPGDASVTVTIGSFVVGLSVCYDLRFPELYRQLVAAGADVLVIPAAFTMVTGKDHWHVLLRARAIESQAYVVAAAQWGTHPRGRRTYGKSLVADPWGDVVAQCAEGEGVAVADVDRAYIERVRANLPALRHRRL
ncbi:MAG TPA: carbon-nitrogen hydrolase family protein [Polyangiaceae bacterium]|nr:carbon-nitrogen hydrolase family protein [Polyangiaceae bacterium]